MKANPLRGAVKPGTEPGLEATEYFGPERGATASGVHAMIITVDPETMKLEIVKYVTAHDCGEVINPLILDGQIHGGIAQGIGNAWYEKLVYDEGGQLLSASFMDYLLPGIHEVPVTEKEVLVTPSPFTPLGAKGVGEGAIHTAPAATMCAINDALVPFGVRANEVPATPNRLWELIRGARS